MMNSKSIRGGLAGKMLRINLSNGKTSTENTKDYAQRFIGGRAINSLLLLNGIESGTVWSDPENLLIFGVGCLVGTFAPGACRTSVETMNAYSNGKGSANFGGHFGAELKFAGFDHVIITGKSEKPVYLWICDGCAELRDASFLWGKTTYETQEVLHGELGDARIKVASIGPAGENRVVGAGILGEGAKMAGGSGVGCVMGDKKLKALAVRGHGAINVAEPDRFLKAADMAFEKIMVSPTAPAWRKTIIRAAFYPGSPAWDLETLIRNGQDEWWPIEKQRNLCDKKVGVPKYIRKVLGCFSCPIGCLPFWEIDEGKYTGTKGTGYWINSAMYSQKFDVDDPAASLKWHHLANELGLDGDMASVSCSWAFECYERGLLTKEDTDDLELTWGNADVMVELLRKLAYREGIGELLADGVLEASKKVGKGSEDFALHVKKQDTYEFFRIAKGWGLGVATSACGPRHLRGAVLLPEMTGPPGSSFSPTEYEGAPEAVFWQGRTKEIEDFTGICVYVGSFFGAHALGVSDYAELVNAAMGLDLTEEELNLIARRAYNLEKAFNTIHAGFDRRDDLPPKRFMEEPVKSGPYAGMKADREEFNNMLDEFYRLHEWDIETGWQTRQCLEELGMEDVAKKLESVGRLM